mmetsp:Transcript_56309/g.150541  ORF Transcript_56309/g.150541 Transcript_56309/m.150541 type:complete len:303 (-) Transcript_56309:61-969(-)
MGEFDASEPAAQDAFRCGESVEVVGLESEAGKLLNGQVGTVLSYDSAKARFQISLVGGSVSVRLSNLRRPSEKVLEPDTGRATTHADSETSPSSCLSVGDRVEVFGLESESGKRLNGRFGVISLPASGRFMVELGPDEVISVKPANLRPSGQVSGKRSSQSSSSSSSSSSSRKKAPRRARKNHVLSADDTLEALLTGSSSRSAKDRDRETAAPEGAQAAQAQSENELKPGDKVMVCGLQSEAGLKLNGKTGLITKCLSDTGRFQVELGLENVQSLKSDNLMHLASAPSTSDHVGSTAGYTLL